MIADDDTATETLVTAEGDGAVVFLLAGIGAGRGIRGGVGVAVIAVLFLFDQFQLAMLFGETGRKFAEIALRVLAVKTACRGAVFRLDDKRRRCVAVQRIVGDERYLARFKGCFFFLAGRVYAHIGRGVALFGTSGRIRERIGRLVIRSAIMVVVVVITATTGNEQQRQQCERQQVGFDG